MCKSNLANVEMPKCAFGGRHWRQLSCNATDQPRGGYLASKVTTGETGIDTHLVLFFFNFVLIFDEKILNP